MEELKPCPFCGTDPIIERYPTLITIKCSRCEIEFFSEQEADEIKLINRWNTRSDKGEIND